MIRNDKCRKLKALPKITLSLPLPTSTWQHIGDREGEEASWRKNLRYKRRWRVKANREVTPINSVSRDITLSSAWHHHILLSGSGKFSWADYLSEIWRAKDAFRKGMWGKCQLTFPPSSALPIKTGLIISGWAWLIVGCWVAAAYGPLWPQR